MTNYFGTLEYQIDRYNDWETEQEELDEARREHLIEHEYVLTPGGDEWDTGTFWQDIDDFGDTGDYVRPDDLDKCGHGNPCTTSARRGHPLYHLEEDGAWHLCDEAVDYDWFAADPNVEPTYQAILEPQYA